jgi:hypothetical protein
MNAPQPTIASAVPTDNQVNLVMLLLAKEPWLYDHNGALIDAAMMRDAFARGERVEVRYRSDASVWCETADHAAITLRTPAEVTRDNPRVGVTLMYASGSRAELVKVAALHQIVLALAAALEAVLA